jgi:phytol kinase
MSNLFINQFSEFILIHVIVFLEGLLVLKFNWKVNYTRKINHFFVFFSPYLLKLIFPFEECLYSQILIAMVGLSTLVIYIKPIRENVNFVATMFAAFDRPEDKPHTLKWLFTQYLVTYLVAVPLWLIFDRIGHTEAIPIIILINAVGDGLAEPIGIKFGKHKYKVKALFTTTSYTRSIEGSACVFVVGVLAIVAYHTSFSTLQFIIALLFVPTVATLAEAKSPHTWDSPFIFLFTGISLLLIYQM